MFNTVNTLASSGRSWCKVSHERFELPSTLKRMSTNSRPPTTLSVAAVSDAVGLSYVRVVSAWTLTHTPWQPSSADSVDERRRNLKEWYDAQLRQQADDAARLTEEITARRNSEWEWWSLRTDNEEHLNRIWAGLSATWQMQIDSVHEARRMLIAEYNAHSHALALAAYSEE